MYQVETHDARTLSQADTRGIAELIVKVWPNPAKPFEYRVQQVANLGRGAVPSDAQAPRSVIVRAEGRVIAHAAITPREIGTSAGPMTVAALAMVCSDPAFRGHGLGELVVREILVPVDQSIFPFALFQTSPPIKPFYEKLGACVADNRIVNSLAEDPQAYPFWNEVVMRYPKDRVWPEGEIDLRGPGY
jgi:predicted N-acetyltransferase YhbS